MATKKIRQMTRDELLSILDPETEDGYKCPLCETVLDSEPDENPGYECGSCGEEFTREDSADGDSNRCPQCNKFGAKQCATTCPECGQGIDGFETGPALLVGSELRLVDDIDDDVLAELAKELAQEPAD